MIKILRSSSENQKVSGTPGHALPSELRVNNKLFNSFTGEVFPHRFLYSWVLLPALTKNFKHKGLP